MGNRFYKIKLTEFEAALPQILKVLVVDNLGNDLVNEDVLQLVLNHEDPLRSHGRCNAQNVDSVLPAESIQRVVDSHVHSRVVRPAPAGKYSVGEIIPFIRSAAV